MENAQLIRSHVYIYTLQVIKTLTRTLRYNSVEYFGPVTVTFRLTGNMQK